MKQYDVDILKVGTNVGASSLSDGHGNDVPYTLNFEVFQHIGDMKSDDGSKIAIVSSIAIAAGMIKTGTMIRPDRKTDMPKLQALSAVGWPKVLNAWDKYIKGPTGGIQVTRQELNPIDEAHKEERSLALNSIYSMLDHDWTPIVNENDAVANDDISFGDNDILAALLAISMARSPERFGRIRLFLMSNTNGVYANYPDESSRIPVITKTADYRHLALESDSPNGSGGMKSKFDAADYVNAVGIDMYVFDPRSGHTIQDAMAGKVGTYFPSQSN